MHAEYYISQEQDANKLNSLFFKVTSHNLSILIMLQLHAFFRVHRGKSLLGTYSLHQRVKALQRAHY